MFNRLQKKWKVSGWRLILILVTFAVGGSLTGYAGKWVMTTLGIHQTAVYVPIYIIVITIIWPMMVLLVSVFTGQFIFFRNYLTKMGNRISGRRYGVVNTAPDSSRLKHITIFASGAGSNVPELTSAGTELVVLAGFLWKIPQKIITAFPKKIINIHPALLPGYGGKGMYGRHVHEAVLNAGDVQSGITIHYVDEHYDHGDVIFQTACPVLPGDTSDMLAQRIHQLEHNHYPAVIENLIKNLHTGS